MKYNKAKVILDRIAGIVGIVLSTLLAVHFARAVWSCIDAFRNPTELDAMLFPLAIGILVVAGVWLVVAIISIILFILLLKNPVRKDGSVDEDRVALRSYSLVLSILTLNAVTAILLIVSFCLRNKKA